MYSGKETIKSEKALNRICSDVHVSCPPAVPIVMPGELIDQQAIDLLNYYEIKYIDVVK